MTIALYFAIVALIVLVWFFFMPAYEGDSVATWAYRVHLARRSRTRRVNDQLAAADQGGSRLDREDRRGFGSYPDGTP